MNSRRKILVPLLLLCAAGFAQYGEESEGPYLGPYYPTPELVAEKMLEFAEIKPGEKMFDLGSGDGRIVILAAQKFEADATGIEIDEDLWRQSMDRIQSLNLQDRARIILGDVMKQDIRSADVVTIYLLRSANEQIRPMLEEQLKKGARIVAHDYDIPGWTPDETRHIDDGGEGRSHTLYLYRR